MAIKERYQNPTIGDKLKLRLLTYNSNSPSDLNRIDKVEIFALDPSFISNENPNGYRLVETIDGLNVIREDEGSYYVLVDVVDSYTIGTLVDSWDVQAIYGEQNHKIEQFFEVYPSLWYSTPMPMVYDFKFSFSPNKFRKGSIQYLIIEVNPNVPTAGDLRTYYENLAIVSDLKISIEQNCGDCVSDIQDLRMIVEDELTDYREKRTAFYKIDTTEMDCGIYNIWFKLEIGGNVYISDKFNLQVYE